MCDGISDQQQADDPYSRCNLTEEHPNLQQSLFLRLLLKLISDVPKKLEGPTTYSNAQGIDQLNEERTYDVKCPFMPLMRHRLVIFNDIWQHAPRQNHRLKKPSADPITNRPPETAPHPCFLWHIPPPKGVVSCNAISSSNLNLLANGVKVD
jgi:hypothetical protein